MKQQTYIVQMFIGADTYRDAARKGLPHDFNRVGCKRVETCLKYAKNWRKQAIEKYFKPSFLRVFWDDEARYEIVSTPDGYHEEGIVASGYMRDL